MMVRRGDWVERLERVVDRARSADYRLGVADCMMFVGDVVLALGGVDPVAFWRGTYSTNLGARRIDGGDLGGFAAGVFDEAGLVRVKPKFSRLGDIALLPGPHGAIYEICLVKVIP